METTRTEKRQSGPTFPREQWAQDWKNQTVKLNEEGNYMLASPWAKWTVEKRDGGWATFVEEQI